MSSYKWFLGVDLVSCFPTKRYYFLQAILYNYYVPLHRTLYLFLNMGPGVRLFMRRICNLDHSFEHSPKFVRMKKTTTSSKGKHTAKTKAEIKAEEAAALERRRAQKEIAAFGEEREGRPGALSADEIWWRRQYEWLKVRGYLLRPRYAPDWIPSWEGSKRHALDCEDGRVLHVRQRSSDCTIDWLIAP
jgi:hypothetical protein